MRLLVDEPRAPVRAVAVVLHGGRSTSVAEVRSYQLAVLRMRPFAASLRRHGRSAGLAVAQVRYGVRGWNGAQRSPVADVDEALDELAARFPDAPIALVGHSMGGRAAVYAAAHDQVRTVVGLAPWLEERDPVRTLTGRRVLLAHGDRDRMTDPRATRRYAQAAEPYAETVTFLSIAGERHAMLHRANLWHDLSTGFVLGTLLDGRPAGLGAQATSVLADTLAGRPTLSV
jgi:alpha-beta hydrolase superfamily lysophospholipase